MSAETYLQIHEKLDYSSFKKIENRNDNNLWLYFSNFVRMAAYYYYFFHDLCENEFEESDKDRKHQEENGILYIFWSKLSTNLTFLVEFIYWKF